MFSLDKSILDRAYLIYTLAMNTQMRVYDYESNPICSSCIFLYNKMLFHKFSFFRMKILLIIKFYKGPIMILAREGARDPKS